MTGLKMGYNNIAVGDVQSIGTNELFRLGCDLMLKML